MIAAVAFAGCAEPADPEPTRSTPMTPVRAAPTETTPSTPAPPPPSPPADPGTAFGPKSYMFGSARLPNETFRVNTDWTTLTFSYWLNSTATCYVIQNEPPAPPATSTGAAPSLSFESPSGTSVVFPIPTQNVCGTSTSGTIAGQQAISKASPNEVGDWALSIRGIGQNVELRVLVDGS